MYDFVLELCNGLIFFVLAQQFGEIQTNNLAKIGKIQRNNLAKFDEIQRNNLWNGFWVRKNFCGGCHILEFHSFYR